MMLYAKSTGFFYAREIHDDDIPSDVTEESSWAFTYAQLMAGQTTGQRIVGDADGRPILLDRLGPTPEEELKAQIMEIESIITPRRLREAALSEEGRAWLAARDAEIALLRRRL